MVTIIAGQADETISGAFTYGDTTNFKVGNQALRLFRTTSGNATAIHTPATPFEVGKAQLIDAWLDVDDLTNITQLNISISSPTDVWTRTVLKANIVVGWNLVRFKASEGSLVDWGTVREVRFVLVATGAASLTVGHLWAERRPEASILLIEDRGHDIRRTWVA